MKNLTFTLIVTIYIFAHSTSFARDAFICDSCTSEHKARSEAAFYANSLQCYSSIPGEPISIDNQICRAEPRHVIIIHPDSSRVFSYSVVKSEQFPFNTQVTEKVINSDLQQGYELLADFYQGLINGINQSQNASLALLNSYSTTASSNCPADTALATLTDSRRYQDLQDSLTLEVSFGWHPNIFTRSSSQTVTESGVSLIFKRMMFTAAFDRGQSQPVISREFSSSESEHHPSFPDHLDFQVTINGFNSRNIPNTSFKLLDSSRVAGIRLSELKGNGGPSAPLIDNECAVNRLRKLAESGYFQTPQGSTSSFGSGTPPIPSSGGALIETCTIHFYQSGRLLYVFRVPVGKCH